jgi:glucosamine--fructose-6-phosphate aminotransferase (isomerizing)
VSEQNAHPHFDTRDRVHVVVNGIVENYVDLKRDLQLRGARFSSETDVEVIAHLIAADLDEYVSARSRRLARFPTARV